MADKRISQLAERTDIANNDVVAIVASGATVTNKATISSIQSYMQTALDVGVTSVGVTLGSSGTDVSVTGSPITTSGNITINIPSASATARGLVTTEAQTFAGAKTFSNSIIAGIDVQLVAAGTANPTILRNTSGTSSTTTGSNVIGFNGTNNIFVTTQNRGGFILGFDNSVSNREYTLQDASGTLAFTSDIPSITGLVTLDTAQTITGEKTFTNNIILKNSSLAGLIVSSFSPNALEIGATLAGITYYSSIVFPAGDQSWNLPNASGTFALTNDLGAYLPLTLTSTQRIVELNGQFFEVYSSANTFTSGRLIVAPTYGAIGYQTNGIFRGLQILTDGTAVLTNTGTLTMTGALNGTSASFTTSGGDDTLIVNHTSGSGIALDIAKAGNGEGLRVAKTSGSGNAVTITGGNLEAPAIVRTGGTSSQFLKADGSVDSSTYLTTGSAASTYLPLVGGTLTGTLEMGTSAPSIFLRGANSGLKSIQYANSGGSIHWSLQTSLGASGEQGTFSIRNGVLGTDAIVIQPASNNITFNNSITNFLGSLSGTGCFFSSDIQTGTRLIAANPSGEIRITPNLSGTTNRIESFGSLPFSLTSVGAITLAAGGTTPQITLATDGAATLTGALNGTSASFTGVVSVSASPSSWVIFKPIQLGLGAFLAGRDDDVSQVWLGANAYYDGGTNFEYKANGFATNYHQSGGSHNFQIAASGTLGNNITFTNALTIASTGAATFSSTVETTGIKFPATQVASADANTLDDYEEGTWTMGISFGGASVGVTTSANTGTYTKIGRQVTVNGFLILTNKGSSSGTALITGLPFTVGNSDANFSTACLRFVNISFANQYQGFGRPNTTSIDIEETTEAGATTIITNDNFANNSNLMVSLTYFV